MIIQHGSEDSIDTDVYVIVPSPILNLQECKELCETYNPYNANLICIKDGIVVWCYKGTIDECNNSILATYRLHSRNIEPCPITRIVKRNVDEKIKRTLRGLLSYVSRTEYRKEVKEALKSEDINFKLNVLKQIKFKDISDFGKKGSNKDVYKFFAFQIIQTVAIMRGDEVFTKITAANYTPSLYKFLYRNVEDPKDTYFLQLYYDFFLLFVEKYYMAQ